MKIRVIDLVKNNQSQKEIDLRKEIKDINLRGDNIRFTEPVHIKGMLVNENGIINLKGRLTLKLELNCHRCSKSYFYEINIDLDEHFMNAENVPDDFYSFSENELDMEPAVMDNIITSIPMKMLCKEDCKGLCEVCGLNKNENECGCKIEETDPRLEVLRKLKNEL